MSRIIILAFSLWGTLALCAQAKLVEYQFSGSISAILPSGNMPFGQSFDMTKPVQGRFVFDTESSNPEIIDASKTSRYLQQIPNGFSATIGGVNISADVYFIEVGNGRPQPGGQFSDNFGVLFQSNTFPSSVPSPSLKVGDSQYDEAAFFLDFRALPTLYSDYSLPATLSPSDFLTRFGFLSDSVDAETVVIDLMFTVASFQQVEVEQIVPVPEPGALGFMLLGVSPVLRRAMKHRT